MPAIYYPAIIDRSASGYGVSFPDFPGCVAAGATEHEAAVNAEAALALHLDGMREDKEQIPPPSSLDAIEAIEGAEDVGKVLVRSEQPEQFVRIQVTLPGTVLAAIDTVASNRSAFLTDAARAFLRGNSEGNPRRYKLKVAGARGHSQRVVGAAAAVAIAGTSGSSTRHG